MGVSRLTKKDIEELKRLGEEAEQATERILNEPWEEKKKRIERLQKKEAERQKGFPPGVSWHDAEIA